MLMSRWKFVFAKEHEGGDNVRLEVHWDASLDDMCETFERYLRACGYQFDGTVIIEEPEDES